MVTKVPLLASQTPLNAVVVGECSGWVKNVLVLQSVVGWCGVTSGCVTSMGGGMRAHAFRCCLPLEEDAEVVGGGNLMVVLRSYMVRLCAFSVWRLSVTVERVFLCIWRAAWYDCDCESCVPAWLLLPGCLRCDVC